MANVGYYLLSISDANPASPTWVWYTPAQAGCASGTGTCTVAAPRTLTSGLVSWMVLTWNTYGYGPWSTTMDAVVNGVDALLAVPIPIAPSGPVTTRTPTYQWNPPSGDVTWYQLSVTDALGSTGEFWYSPGQACPSSPCAVTPSTLLAMSPAQWQVRAWSTAGASAWTTAVGFEAASAAPGKATLVASVGPVTSTTPTLTWNGVLGTSYYLLRIIDQDNVEIERWYRPSQVACPLGTETCTASPGILVAPGPATWNVLTWNASGYGPWSDPGEFSVEIADPLAAVPQPVSPNGAVATVYPTYTWTAVAGAALYRLSVRSNGGTPTQWWYTPAAGGCDTATACSAVPMSEPSTGTAEWQVQAWTVNGHGNWSAAVPLTVSIPAPTVSILVSPDGSASATPPFVWTASANATYYYVRVDDATGLRVDRWVRPDQVGCLGGIGSCALNAGVTLSSGAGSWRVIAWNPSGYSL